MKFVILNFSWLWYFLGLLYAVPIEKDLNAAFANLMEDEDFEGEHRYVAKKQALSGEKSIAKTGLLSLVLLRGDFEVVELVWWKSKDEEVRKLCINLLFYKANDPVIQIDKLAELKKNCQRFTKTEEHLRLAELDDSVNNLEVYRKLAKRLNELKTRLAERHNSVPEK